MESAPLNLAHFNERRAEKLMKLHRYDEAYSAIETSLAYLNEAYKNVLISKSIEVLDTQKWDYERKLRQIEIRKQQYERLKHKNVADTSIIQQLRTESISGQMAAKAIDKTVRDFDFKLTLLKLSKEVQDKNNTLSNPIDGLQKPIQSSEINCDQSVVTNEVRKFNCVFDNDDDMPSLVPLELPSFDYNVISTSSPSLATTADLAENFQK